ncbi:SpoIIE family protein phosphatase [Nonomuraea sp. NPDC002799]
MDPPRDYLDRLADLDARIEQARSAPDVVIGRASGLLAGRTGCRIGEAHAYLLRSAAEQRRAVHELAADVVATLEGQATREAVADLVLRPAFPLAAEEARTGSPPADAWVRTVQQILDALPDRHMLLIPQYDASGRIEDYTFAAASRGAVDLSGRHGAQILGRRASEVYPTIVGGPVWEAWGQTAGDGRPREVGPMAYVSPAERAPAEVMLTVRVRPVGSGLLNSWVRHDEETRLAERIAHTERLGNLGWGEWDLVTGQIHWSDELYRIYERDPAEGPLPREQSEALTLPEDVPLRRQAAEDFGRGRPVDVTYRIRVAGRVKHIHTVADAVRDGGGQPIKVYGIIQDITASETSRIRLIEIERQLLEHQRSLAAEHDLTVQLQQIVLPVPREPIDLPGLRVAVRYLPAEHAGRVGGDWFHAAPAGDGSVMLAVGDVAGHGLQAAAVMAQLRHALAAMSVTTTNDPRRLLGHLNRLLFTGEAAGAGAVNRVPVTATAVVARYEPATGTLVWAQAGHPAPLLAHGGDTVELERPDGPLLGAFPAAVYTTATTTLRPGDLLLFYTDGLVEHRRHSLDEGLAPVLATLNRITAEHTPQPLADLLAQLRQANPDDDTCILAVRPLAATEPAGRGG